MQTIKIGIIGLGKAWDYLHGPSFAQLEDKFTIKALCNPDRRKAELVAEAVKLPQEAVYEDYNKMLKEADIEAVATMVPISENYECALAAINHGKHLFAEKPLAATQKSAKELIKLRKSKGITMLVAENSRYEEENLLIKRLLEERRIGNPVYFIDNHVIEFQKDMVNDQAFAASPWRREADFRGGVFLDSGVHHAARHRFLFGGVRTLYALGRPSDAEFAPYSCVNALLTFDNYIAGHYTFFVIGKETQAPAVGLRIFGTEGEIYLENKNCGILNVSHKDGSHEAIPFKPESGYAHELNNFYEALCCGKEVTSTPEKALGDMEVIFSILESIEGDKRLKLAT